MKRQMLLGVATAGLITLSACGTPSNDSPATIGAPTDAPVTIVAPTQAAATTAPEATAIATAGVATSATTGTQTTAPQPTSNPSLTPALQEFVSGLDKPTYLTYAPGDNGLLYVTEQPGRIRIIQNGALVEAPFLDITDRVGDSGNEQGLLSVAFAPDFVQSRKLFINYTDENGDTVVSGLLAAADGRSADPNGEWPVIKIAQPYANHNGGQLKFGPDGMLYIGMGDGGSQGDPQNRAQNRDDLLGKILRIDVSQSSADAPYTVPDNNVPSGEPEVWALGLRNPWRFSFDRATGDVFIADVGQNKLEEVNMQPANQGGGANYGWDILEGTEQYSDGSVDGAIAPIWEYQHGGDGCSVTGGYVYRGAAVGALTGAYVYGDYCSGKIWSLRPGNDGNWSNSVLFETGSSVTSFGEDAQGELYVLTRDGVINRIVGE